MKRDIGFESTTLSLGRSGASVGGGSRALQVVQNIGNRSESNSHSAPPEAPFSSDFVSGLCLGKEGPSSPAGASHQESDRLLSVRQVRALRWDADIDLAARVVAIAGEGEVKLSADVAASSGACGYRTRYGSRRATSLLLSEGRPQRISRAADFKLSAGTLTRCHPQFFPAETLSRPTSRPRKRPLLG
jgi:hypothetical protein